MPVHLCGSVHLGLHQLYWFSLLQYHCISRLVEWWYVPFFLFVCLLLNTEGIRRTVLTHSMFITLGCHLYWFESKCHFQSLPNLLEFPGRYYHINSILPALCFIYIYVGLRPTISLKGP